MVSKNIVVPYCDHSQTVPATATTIATPATMSGRDVTDGAKLSRIGWFQNLL
jgi:hypothetical protein